MCSCYTCHAAARTEDEFWFAIMYLCPTCGNKRCPGAANHENECTGSNEPGQPGSLYPAPRLDDTRTLKERIADAFKSAEEEEN